MNYAPILIHEAGICNRFFEKYQTFDENALFLLTRLFECHIVKVRSPSKRSLRMKNRIYTLRSMFAIMLITLALLLVALTQRQSILATAVDDPVVLEFTAISDIHVKSTPSIERERFADAIQLSYQHTNSLDAVIINGDFSDGGHDPQYAAFLDILNQNVTGDTEVIVNLGNHENGRNESDSHEYFREQMGYGIDHVFEVNGYYFITLGVHYGDRYLDTQALWLQSKLEIITTENPDQPVFVLIHYPVYQTTINSTRNGRLTFKNVLDQFPQAIHISGHSHPALQDPRVIHQDTFTSFNNSSLSYLFYEKADFMGSQDTASVGQFAISKVTQSNKVIIERYVINDADVNNSVKLEGDYIIDIPKGRAGFTYTTGWYDDGTKPYFEATTAVSLTKVADSWRITFDQALDQQFVYYYHIYIKDLGTGSVVKVIKPNSLFYLGNPPAVLSRDFTANLNIGMSYEVSIVAVSVTNRTSAPLVKTITLQ
jgi:predicted MPP superfamily phosphohydrolase